MPAPQRNSLARRSAMEWGVRGLLAAIAVAAGSVSVSYALGYTLKANPAQAHALAPGDGRITARLSQAFATIKATTADRAKADRLAREALRQDPTAVAAVATLGLNAQIRGETATARRLFVYSQTLSRRDLQTQLWAIEEAVARNDIPGALRRYDIALRTKRNAANLLFPVLASAVDDPAIRSALIKTLSATPHWGESFIYYAGSEGPDPRAVARLYLGLRRTGVTVAEGWGALLIDRLIKAGFPDDAWAYYASLRPGVDRRMSRDLRFTADIDARTPFDWTPANDAGLATSIQHGEQGGFFEFATPPGAAGALLRQVQILPPGDYRLEGRSSGIDQAEGSRPYWALTCQSGRELGRVAMPNSAQANGAFAGRFSVPAGCPAQTLSLVARPSELVGGVVGQIAQVRLYPAR